MARFDKPEVALMKFQRYITYYSFAAVYLLLTVASAIVIVSVSWGYQALITAIEAILLFIIFIILHILERKYDPSPCSDQEYVQIGVKKYGKDIAFSGVPNGYNNSLREREEIRNIEYRKLALSSILKSVQVSNKDGFFSTGTLNSCRMPKKMRRAFSHTNLPAIEEEDSDENSDEEVDFFYKPRRKRRFSIGTENKLEKYADKRFFSVIDDIRNGKYLPDNVFADSHPERVISEQDRE
jgi:hypothetical protein